MHRLTWSRGGGCWRRLRRLRRAADACSPPTGLSDVMERPAERALLTGMRAYDDAPVRAGRDAR